MSISSYSLGSKHVVHLVPLRAHGAYYIAVKAAAAEVTRKTEKNELHYEEEDMIERAADALLLMVESNSKRSTSKNISCLFMMLMSN